MSVIRSLDVRTRSRLLPVDEACVVAPAPRAENAQSGIGRVRCFAIKRYHFAPMEKELLDQPKSLFCICLRMADKPELRDGAHHWAIHGDFGSKGRGRERGFGFEFPPWLAISSERVRSRNPCGIRTRDECSKRSGQPGWTAEHNVPPPATRRRLLELSGPFHNQGLFVRSVSTSLPGPKGGTLPVRHEIPKQPA